MKTPLFALALTAAIAGLPTQNAHASDYKLYNGSGCKVFGTTAWTDLQFGAFGIINLTNSPKNIICPIIKDSEGAYDSSAITPVNAASVHVHIASRGLAARTVCNVYVMANGSDIALEHTYTVDTGTLAKNTEFDGNIGNFDSTYGDHTSLMMLCTLGPQSAIRFSRLDEQGPTSS